MIRTFKTKNMRYEVGLPVRYEGRVVGKTINSDEIMIDDDEVYRMLTSDQASVSVEVICKDD